MTACDAFRSNLLSNKVSGVFAQIPTTCSVLVCQFSCRAVGSSHVRGRGGRLDFEWWDLRMRFLWQQN